MRSPSLSPGAARLWPCVVGFAPSVVLLAMMLPLRGLVPFLDSWRFVGQYKNWMDGQYGWGAFLAPHYAHPSVVGKLIYFAVLHWLHGEVGLLPFLSWGFSAFIAVCVCLLSRPLWVGKPVQGGLLMLCANLIIFSPAQGEAWLWDFLFQNFIPGACLVAGIVILSAGRLAAGRITAAAALGVIAAFSFASGFLVGALFSILIWDGTRGMSPAQRCLRMGAWLAFIGIVTSSAVLPAADAEGTAVGDLLVPDRPGMRLQFLLALLGRMLGEGTVFEPQKLAAVMGGALLLVFLACVAFLIHHRHHRGLVSASLPWIACSLYGLGSALLICQGRMQKSLGLALADRYASLTLFFVLGTLFLAVAVLRHGVPATTSVRWLRKSSVPLLTVFIAALVLNWKQGNQTMKLWHTRMEQERAMLAFVRVLPPDPGWMGDRQTRRSTFRLAKFLADHDRLRHVTMASDNRLSAYQQGEKVPAEWACLDKPVRLDDGRWKLGGRGGLWDNSVADLILITAESAAGGEQIVALAAPFLPDTFWERLAQRRRYPEHFFGWSQTISLAALPVGELTLRAYIIDHDKQHVRPMDGTHKVGVHQN